MIYLVHIFIALNLFAAAFAGALYSKRLRRIPAVSFFYFGWSLAGQVLALPLLILTLISLFVALFTIQLSFTIVIINFATLALFCLTLLRSWQASQLLSQVAADRKNASFTRFLIGALFPFQLPKRDVKRIKNIAYGPSGQKNKLDIYMPKTKPELPMPVLVHIHGGGWVVGRKHQQAKPLIQHMASKGWLVVDINYRLGPRNRMPAMIQDVLLSIAWVKTNIETYSGDPDFVAVTGGSAGGHLASLAALVSSVESLKPGFEQLDCAIDACVPVYGVYDFRQCDDVGNDDERNDGIQAFQSFLSKAVMPGPTEKHQALWEQVSPMAQIHPDAPPMLITHGRHDALVSLASAKAFAENLSQISSNKVIFVELPSAQHAFDIAYAPPTPEHVRTVHRFLESVRVAKREVQKAVQKEVQKKRRKKSNNT